MQCDLITEGPRIDSALDSTRKAAQGGTVREKEAARFTSPISPSISQSSIVKPPTKVQPLSLSAQYLGAPAPSPSPRSSQSELEKAWRVHARRVILCYALRYWDGTGRQTSYLSTVCVCASHTT